MNKRGGEGDTALMRAVSLGDMDSCRALIAAGADVDPKNSNGLTPLLLANNSDFVKVLIAGGADVNKRGGEGDTALMRAVSLGDLDSCQALIAAGADAHAKNKADDTALTLARRRPEITKVLTAEAPSR